MQTLGFIFAFAAAITWGAAYTADQKILTTLSPLALLMIHALLTTLILLPFFFTDKSVGRSLVSTNKQTLFLIVISVILTLLANFFILSSIDRLGAATASIFEIMYPFFVILFSMIFFRTSLTVPFFVGALLIFAGSAVILTHQ